MLNEFGAVIVFILLGTAFVFGSLVFGWFVRLGNPTKEKNDIYECGEPTVGSSWIRFNTRFYNVALVYLLFDVEVVLLIPFVLVYRDKVLCNQGMTVLLGLLVFFFLLTLGLAYEWFYGNLDWIKRDTK